jgi:GTPase SAR1 family protein
MNDAETSPVLDPQLLKVKVVFLGNAGVGKTSIIQRFIYGTYDQAYHTTIGVDYVSKTMIADNTEVRL